MIIMTGGRGGEGTNKCKSYNDILKGGVILMKEVHIEMGLWRWGQGGRGEIDTPMI